MRLLIFGVTLCILLAGPVAAEQRQLVELPEVMREHMLANMRDHLAALAEAQSLAAAEKWDQASELVEHRLGMSSLEAHGAAHMAPYMPPAMQQLGTAMHRAASRLSRSLAEADPQKSLAGLAQLTACCAACHAAFRVR